MLARISKDRRMASFVTVVHGTFARGAEWIKQDSTLTRFLRKNIRNGPVHIQPFLWSGANKISARINAADELRCVLVDQVKTHPNDRHFVIGHSHGGNLAMLAIQTNAVLKQHVGLICLSTPFLQLERQKFSKPLRKKFGTLRLCFWLLPIAVNNLMIGLNSMPVFSGFRAP